MKVWTLYGGCIGFSFHWPLTVGAISSLSSATTAAGWRSHCFTVPSIVMGRSSRRLAPKCSSLLTSGSRKSATIIGSWIDPAIGSGRAGRTYGWTV